MRRQERARSFHRVFRIGLQADDRWQRIGGPAHGIQHTRRFEHQQPRLAVGEAPRDVLGIVDHVERNHDEAKAEAGLVDRNPVHAVLHAQGNAVATLEAALEECLLPARGEIDDLAGRVAFPLLPGPLLIQHLRGGGLVLLQRFGEVVHGGERQSDGATIARFRRQLEAGRFREDEMNAVVLIRTPKFDFVEDGPSKPVRPSI